MKKIMLLIAVAGIAFFVSCKKEERSEELATWRSTNQYFSRTVDGSETMKEERELSLSTDVSEAEAYFLTLNEDGTGHGSGVRPDGKGRYDFAFTWTSSDGVFSMSATKSGYGGVFFTYDEIALSSVSWTIEESSDEKMVLSQRWDADIDGTVNGIPTAWFEAEIYRYTFERVE